MPDYLLVPQSLPMAKGGSRELLLEWGLKQSEELRMGNCRFYELRMLNDPERAEPKPFYCCEEESNESCSF